MSETLVVLVSSRGALATLAGVPSVVRHVQAGRTLGLDVVVVYPPERRALGAEIRGLVEQHASCIPADQFTSQFTDSSAQPDGSLALVVAAEWYLSLSAILTVRDAAAPRTFGRVFGRVCERGCISVPVARVTRSEAAHAALQLGTTSAATSLATLLDEAAATVDLDSRSEQRLSDNISTAHAEEKLVEHLFGPQRLLPLLRLRPTIAPLLARRFNDTTVGPAGISGLKLIVGLAAAWIIGGGSYTDGLAGALLYFVARVIGASGIVLARASLADSDIRGRLDLAGDTILHIALLWSLAAGPARDHGGVLLAAVATVGVLVSTGVAYVFVLRGTWLTPPHQGSAAAAVRVPAPSAAGNEFIARFVQRDGIAYALLFAAATASLDLFLWAAALASHLFYLLWLLTRSRREDGTLAFGRSA
ncbi:MAG: hypothetical protein ABR587_03135 [Candidatus Binatia bacterium]